MSPIFVRPVREQLEHDRLIRYLQTKYRRKYEPAINVGDEQAAPVKLGSATCFPDLVLMSGRALAGVVEVETGESVNNLEAMAQWIPFGRARAAFHLYVPVQAYDTARRLCETHGVRVAEIWTYRPAMEGFDLVRMFHDAKADRAGSAKKAAAKKPAAKKAAAAKSKPKAKAKTAAAKKPAAKKAAAPRRGALKK